MYLKTSQLCRKARPINWYPSLPPLLCGWTIPLNFFYEYICKLFTYSICVSFPGTVSALQQDETQLVIYENVPLWRLQRHNKILNFWSQGLATPSCITCVQAASQPIRDKSRASKLANLSFIIRLGALQLILGNQSPGYLDGIQRWLLNILKALPAEIWTPWRNP